MYDKIHKLIQDNADNLDFIRGVMEASEIYKEGTNAIVEQLQNISKEYEEIFNEMNSLLNTYKARVEELEAEKK